MEEFVYLVALIINKNEEEEEVKLRLVKANRYPYEISQDHSRKRVQFLRNLGARWKTENSAVRENSRRKLTIEGYFRGSNEEVYRMYKELKIDDVIKFRKLQ